MQIPKEFVLFGQPIKIIIKEIDNKLAARFGFYDCAKEEIILYKKVLTDNEEIELSNLQIFTTLLHELIHAIQWHVKGDFDEWEANTYAGLLIEFFNSSEIKINPNVIYEPIRNNDKSDI